MNVHCFVKFGLIKKITALWDTTLCSFVEKYRRFGEACCLPSRVDDINPVWKFAHCIPLWPSLFPDHFFRTFALFIYPEDGGSAFIRSTRTYLLNCSISYTKISNVYRHRPKNPIYEVYFFQNYFLLRVFTLAYLSYV